MSGTVNGAPADGLRHLQGSISPSCPLSCGFAAGQQWSCGPFVLVDQPAEDPAALYSCRGQAGDRGCADVADVRWLQVPGPVRAMVVVVRDVLGQDRAQVPRPGDQHPVGELGPGGPYPALGIS